MERTLIQSSSRNPQATYGVAVACAIAALLIRLPLSPVLQDKVPYITFFVATTVSASFGGFGPGLLTTVLGAVLAGLYVVPPFGSLMFKDLGDFLGFGIFLATSGFISYLAGQLIEAGKKADALRLLFQQTLHSIGDAVISTDLEKRVLLMNDVAEKLTGWTIAEGKGKLIADVFRIVREGSDIPAEIPIDRIIETGTVVGLANHTELINKGGQRIPIDDSGAPIRDSGGRIVGAVLVFRDITTRREAELNLLASERRSREILESIADAFVLLDTDWRLADMNPAAEKLLKAPAEALLGKNHWDLFPTTMGTELEKAYRTAMADRVPLRLEYHYEPWGQWFDISAYQSDQGLALYFRDISERKNAQRRDAFLVHLDDAVRPLTDPNSITQKAAQMLGEHLEVNRCAYADVEDDEDTFNLTGDYNRGVPSIVGRYTFTDFGAECLRLMREGKPYVVFDSETDERTEKVRQSYRLTLIGSVICVPLLKEGRFVAAMAVHQTTPRRWQQHEVELVQQVANRCWESIERTRVSRELQEREERYRFLAQSIPQMVWTATPDGNLDYVNGQVTAYFGTDFGTVLGEGWLKWVHPEDKAGAIERWGHSIKTGLPYETAFRLLRESDQSWRWHLVRAQPMMNADGQVGRWFGTCTDFEDQKQAENDRKRSQELLQMVIDRVPGLVSYLDAEVHYAFTNSRYSDWFGSGPFVGQKVRDVVGEAAFARAWPYMERAYAGEEVRFEEFLPYDPSKPRYVQVSYTPHKAESGKVKGVVATIQDITAQKTMEEALRRSEERLQQVFAQAPVAIVVFRGRDFVTELANPSYQRLVQGRELIGRKFTDFVPEIGSDVLDAFRQVMETGEPYVRDDFYVPYDQDGDGVIEDHWFNLVYHPLREADGSVTGLVAVSNEVTVQVRARQELERVNRELEEFAYVASHDLQEPLRMVNVYTQLLMRRYVGDEPQAKQYAAIIHQGVNRMEALIHDLLAFSRTIHSDDIQTSTADLSAALAEATSILRGRIEESGANVTAPLLPTVQGDTAQLALVFQNLLSNSMKYMKNDTQPDIHITAECHGVNWTIAVRDNGIGFEPKYAERVFGLFKRLHKDEYPGTGLGLAICRRIVERHKGRIWAESTPGQGSTFYISLPRFEGA